MIGLVIYPRTVGDAPTSLSAGTTIHGVKAVLEHMDELWTRRRQRKGVDE